MQHKPVPGNSLQWTGPSAFHVYSYLISGVGILLLAVLLLPRVAG